MVHDEHLAVTGMAQVAQVFFSLVTGRSRFKSKQKNVVPSVL